MTIRPRQPDFKVTLHDTEPDSRSGRDQGVPHRRESPGRLRRADCIDITGLPPGFTASTPVVIEAGQMQAYGTLTCAADAPAPDEQNQSASATSSAALIRGEQVTHPGAGFGKITREATLERSGRIVAAETGARPVAMPADGPIEFEIAPGETIMLKAVVERPENTKEVLLGREDAGRNMPHGVYVDNIGLNGLLLLDGQTEREFFVTAAKWVPEQSRLFHLKSDGVSFATPPVLLHVRRRPDASP